MSGTVAVAAGRRRTAGRKVQRFWRGTVGLLAVLALWQLSVPLVGLESYFYPSPQDVLVAFWDMLRKGILVGDLVDSAGRFLAGIGLGVAIGVIAGLMLGLSRTVSRAMGPLLNFLYAIVEVAWIPIFVLWWGYGLQTILVALTYVVFFPVLFNTILGVRSVPPVLINAARSHGAGRLATLREVILPCTLPNIITGFRVGAGFAFRGLIFAEMIAAKSGLGYRLFETASNQQTARTIAGMIVMGLLWLLIDNFYVKPFEKATIERWGVVSTAEEGQ